MAENTKYFVLKEKAVPEVLLKVVEAKRLLESGRVTSVQEAAEQVDISRSSFYKYKDDIFYHATGGTSEIGVGKGLYLGKDKNAVHNFYNGEGEFGDEVEIYQGSPNFIDLTEPKKFEEFEKEAIAKYGKSSDKNYLNKNTLRLGFDGIRYFDPCTTGEEFVLFNVDKVKMISNKKRKKEDLSNFFN